MRRSPAAQFFELVVGKPQLPSNYSNFASVCFVFLRFQPKRIDDSEQHGKAEAEYPGEIPHGKSFPKLVEGLVVGRDEIASYLAAHNVIGPTGIGQHNGGKDQCNPEHDVQRYVAGCDIPCG
jgi:hypothetical protein